MNKSGIPVISAAAYVQEKGVGMDDAMIVSAKQHSAEIYVSLLKEEKCEKISVASDAAQARTMFSQGDYGIVIIDTPLRDGSAEDLACEFLRNSAASVMLVVRAECEAQAEAAAAGYGALVLTKPLSRTLFSKSLRLMQATRIRICGVRTENLKLQRKIDDIRIINRAKGILMEYLSMSELQAHKYLEKQAMDLRLTKIEVAKNLLSTYDS